MTKLNVTIKTLLYEEYILIQKKYCGDYNYGYRKLIMTTRGLP